MEAAIAVAYSPEDGCYLAWSPQLRCVRDGQSPDEAAAMCQEAMEILLEGLMERGTLESFLAEHGYSHASVTNGKGPTECYLLNDGPLYRHPSPPGPELPDNLELTSFAKRTITPGIPAHV